MIHTVSYLLAISSMEKHVESKYFFTKFGHFYFLFLLYFTCTSIITFWIYIYIYMCVCVPVYV